MNAIINSHKNWQTQRWRAAIPRHKISMPFRVWLERGYIQENDTILDFGCGYGSCVEKLKKNGYQAWGYDPYYFDDQNLLQRKYSVVSLNYVLNVIECQAEVVETIKVAWELCTSHLLISFRPGNDVIEYTKIKTFQQYFSDRGIAQLVEKSIGVEPLKISRGLICIPKSKRMFYLEKSMEFSISTNSIKNLIEVVDPKAGLGQLSYANGVLSLLVKTEQGSTLFSVSEDLGLQEFSFPICPELILDLCQKTKFKTLKFRADATGLSVVQGKKKVKVSVGQNSIELDDRNWGDSIVIPFDPIYKAMDLCQSDTDIVLNGVDNGFGCLYTSGSDVVNATTFRYEGQSLTVPIPADVWQYLNRNKNNQEIILRISENCDFVRLMNLQLEGSVVIDRYIGDRPFDLPDSIFRIAGANLYNYEFLSLETLEKSTHDEVELQISGRKLRIEFGEEFVEFFGSQDNPNVNFQCKLNRIKFIKALSIEEEQPYLQIVNHNSLKGIMIGFSSGTKTFLFSETVEEMPTTLNEEPKPQSEVISESLNCDKSKLVVTKTELPIMSEDDSLYKLLNGVRAKREEIETAMQNATSPEKEKLQQILTQLDNIILLGDRELSKDDYDFKEIEAIRLQLLWTGGRMISFALKKASSWKFSVTIVK